jgi:hypothetical protein
MPRKHLSRSLRKREDLKGKAFLAKAPAPLLNLQEFDPSGLEQTYRDEATGAELPVFAVFNLEGNHQFALEITTETVPTTADSTSLPAYTAEFNGILPKEARKKALVARDHFDELYLIVDQQNRWKSALLTDPRPRALDPLLIGELKQGDKRKYFVIDQFDLTEAEQYLTDEFAAKSA